MRRLFIQEERKTSPKALTTGPTLAWVRAKMREPVEGLHLSEGEIRRFSSWY